MCTDIMLETSEGKRELTWGDVDWDVNASPKFCLANSLTNSVRGKKLRLEIDAIMSTHDLHVQNAVLLLVMLCVHLVPVSRLMAGGREERKLPWQQLPWPCSDTRLTPLSRELRATCTRRHFTVRMNWLGYTRVRGKETKAN